MRIPKRLTTGIALFTGIALAITGCGGGGDTPQAASSPAATSSPDMDALVKAAKAEGEVTFYTGLAQPDAEAWTRDFTDEYGIKVNILRDSSGPLFQRWVTEANAGQHEVDVFLGSDPGAFREADERGLVADYKVTDDAAFDPAYKIAGKSYPIVFQVQPLTWNTSKVTPEEQQQLLTEGVRALTDPRWKGRIALVVPQGTAIIRAEYARLVDKYGWELLEGIAANQPTLYDSAVPLTDRLVAGEQDVAVFVTSSLTGAQAVKGAPVRFAWDSSQVVGWFGLVVAQDAPHPNAARLFLEWATSKDAVESLAAIRQTVGGRNDVENTAEITKKDWYQPLDPSTYVSTWATDPNFDADADAFNSRWSKTFGYQS
jgi:iron(III) transport system substrate-binding protein